MRLGDTKLGNSLEIFITRDNYRLRVVSKIEVVKLDRIYVSLIVGRSGNPLQILDSDQVEFIYREEKRLFIFRNMKMSVETFEDERFHCLSGNIIGESYNRRAAYRVYLGEEYKFHFVSQEYVDILLDNKENFVNIESPKLRKNCQALVKDISESGIGFYSKEQLNIGDYVYFNIGTPYGFIECVAQVVRTQEDEIVFNRTYYGATFAEVSKDINKIIYAMQRTELQKLRAK